MRIHSRQQFHNMNINLHFDCNLSTINTNLFFRFGIQTILRILKW